MFSCEFCQISKNTFFKAHLWATASILCEGRRLMQIEISIFSKLHKENNKKLKMFLHFRFFTCCAHPFFFFWASLFIKRPYVSLYSYFHYAQTCWICKTNLNTYVKNWKSMLILKFHLRMKCLHVFFSFRDETSCLSFILGWTHPRMKFHLGKNV